MKGRYGRLAMETFGFRDDFEEYRARAHSGGNIFGLIRRQGRYEELDVNAPAVSFTDMASPTATVHSNHPAAAAATAGTTTLTCMGGTTRLRSKSMTPRTQPSRRQFLTQKSNSCENILDTNTTDSYCENVVSFAVPSYLNVDRPSTWDADTDDLGGNTRVEPHSSSWDYYRDDEDLPNVDSMFLQPPPLQRQRAQSAPNTNLLVHSGEEAHYRRRSFCITNKGIVHEGDFLVTKPPGSGYCGLPEVSINNGGVDSASRASSLNSSDGLLSPYSGCSSEGSSMCRILVLGSAGVGKTSLTRQFLTCEHLGAQNVSFDEGVDCSVSIMIDGDEYMLEFLDSDQSEDVGAWRTMEADAYVIVYSITERGSFEYARSVLTDIRENYQCSSAAILVANKSDLVRRREVTEQEGRSTAVALDSKYTEVSILLNHKVDDLLVGIVKQIKFTPERHRKRSKGKHKFPSGESSNCLLRARHNVLEKLLGRKAKSCENLLVL